MSLSTLFGVTLFPPFNFFPSSITSPPQTDQAAYDDIVARLNATGLFGDVRHSTADQILFPSAGDYPFAAIVPVSASDADTFDEGGMLRTVAYTLVIAVHHEDPVARKDKLGVLEATARNIIPGQSLAGLSFPAMTKLGAASYPRPRHPEQRTEIAGSFTYLVEGYAGHDTTETYVY
jgi:hypothetical protein